MKIFCIMIAKDEGDIVYETVSHAAAWADKIFLLDNGSSDHTSKEFQRLQDDKKNVTYLGINFQKFSDAMICEVFQKNKTYSSFGDWWCRLDADEIYIDNPREILNNIPKCYDELWSEHYDFWFTEKNMESYLKDKDKYLLAPVMKRMHWYSNGDSEPRFWKHTFPFIWNASRPKFRICSSPIKIRLAQYQYRSPDQINKRIANRKELNASSESNIFSHEICRDLSIKESSPPFLSKKYRDFARIVECEGLLFSMDIFGHFTGNLSYKSFKPVPLRIRFRVVCLLEFIVKIVYLRLKNILQNNNILRK